MALFVRRLLLAAVPLLVYFSLNAIINYTIIRSTSPAIPKSDLLVVGDSHTQVSLDPTVFQSASNIAQYAEPYAATFWKLRSIIPVARPTTVVIGFSQHNIAAFNDRKFDDKQWSTEMFTRTYAIHRYGRADSIKINYQEYVRVLWKNICLFPRFNHYDHLRGGYSNVTRSEVDDAAEAIQRHFLDESGSYAGISRSSEMYLDSILRLCEVHQVTPLLVATPVHRTYSDRIPEPIDRRFSRLRDSLARTHWIIDMTNEHYPDSLFLNSDHLNTRGAHRFSEDIKSLIEEHANTNPR